MTKKVAQLGFMAVSQTAAIRMVIFPFVPGFDKTGPLADLQTQLEKAGDWKGYAVSIDVKGSLRVKSLSKKK